MGSRFGVSKKEVIIYVILGLVLTYVTAFLDFAFNITTGDIGIPFGFSSFNFLGSSTDYTLFFANVFFWSFVVGVFWKFSIKFYKK